MFSSHEVNNLFEINIEEVKDYKYKTTKSKNNIIEMEIIMN